MEIWKTISGFEEYEVSNIGNVRHGNKYLAKINKSGYYGVTLVKYGIKKQMLIHRLVALEFIDCPNPLLTVNHINGDKHDNRVENLEFLSRKENTKHAHRIGIARQRSLVCEQNGIAYKSMKLCAEKLGLSIKSVEYMLDGNYSQAGGYTFIEIERKEFYSIAGDNEFIEIPEYDTKPFKKQEYGHRGIPIVCNETGIEYPSIKNCAECMGLNPSGIEKVVNGIHKQSKGYTFSKVNKE